VIPPDSSQGFLKIPSGVSEIPRDGVISKVLEGVSENP